MKCPECGDPECVNYDQCDYCPECGMMGEHDDRCPVLAELRVERADWLRDAERHGDGKLAPTPDGV